MKIDFLPVTPEHFDMLWEWYQRPHVSRWFAHFMPPTKGETLATWAAMAAGKEPQRGYLMQVDGEPVGYIEAYRLRDSPEMAGPLALEHDCVAADLFLADEARTGHGLGPQLVGRFYLLMMDQTGLDIGLIDPEVGNDRAVSAYTRAGFSHLRVLDVGGPRGRSHIMTATRAEIEQALLDRS
jgi:aminoglycoside 6'-N-acetyltransferase